MQWVEFEPRPGSRYCQTGDDFAFTTIWLNAPTFGEQQQLLEKLRLTDCIELKADA
jgi:hypothetical protein